MPRAFAGVFGEKFVDRLLNLYYKDFVRTGNKRSGNNFFSCNCS
jgi:hypothetical protein